MLFKKMFIYALTIRYFFSLDVICERIILSTGTVINLFLLKNEGDQQFEFELLTTPISIKRVGLGLWC